MSNTSIYQENYPHGTHFSDGNRVGVISTGLYVPPPAGGNIDFATYVPTPAQTQKNPGILQGPCSTYWITPYPKSTSGGVVSTTSSNPPSGGGTNKAGWLTLNSAQNYITNGIANLPLSTPVTLQIKDQGTLYSSSVTGALVFDVPRCLQINQSVAAQQNTFIVAFGADAYGLPVVGGLYLLTTGGMQIDPATPKGEALANSTNFISVLPKSIKALYGIYIGGSGIAANTANITIDTSNVFGLPYAVNNQSQIQSMMWDGHPVYGNVGIQATTATSLTKFQYINTYFGPASLAVPNIFGMYGNTSNHNTASDSIIFGANQVINTTANHAYSDITSIENFEAASPRPLAIGNLTPVAKMFDNDVRGLIAIPDTYIDETNGSNPYFSTVSNNPNYSYDFAGGITQAKALMMTIYYPYVNVEKPGVYTDLSQFQDAQGNPYPQFAGQDITPELGSPQVIPMPGFGPSAFQPYYVPTSPTPDVFGYPQFCTNTGTVFKVDMSQPF